MKPEKARLFARHRRNLPQLGTDLFLTDGGIETTLIFHDGFNLPHFAAFELLGTSKGRAALTDYFERYLSVAERDGRGFVLESPTWRASRDWGALLGYSADDMAAVNRDAVAMLASIRRSYDGRVRPIVISGCVGPRGDGYDPGQVMTAEQAYYYHVHQVTAFAGTEADMVTGITMTNTPEAIGLLRAANLAGIPAVISFTLETDGSLPTGQSLKDAIQEVDAATDVPPAYYMINCAHPTHFDAILLQPDEVWTRRIRGLRANASRMSHEELDTSPTLDDGDPEELGGQYRDLWAALPSITVAGGCCGTDHRHIGCISHACKIAA